MVRGTADRLKGREFETDRKCHWKSSGRASGLKAPQDFSKSLAKLALFNPQQTEENRHKTKKKLITPNYSHIFTETDERLFQRQLIADSKLPRF